MLVGLVEEDVSEAVEEELVVVVDAGSVRGVVDEGKDSKVEAPGCADPTPVVAANVLYEF